MLNLLQYLFLMHCFRFRIKPARYRNVEVVHQRQVNAADKLGRTGEKPRRYEFYSIEVIMEKL